MLTFRDPGKMFELKGDLLKMITIKNYIIDLAILSDKNLMYDSTKEMIFDVKSPGSESTRDSTLIKLLKSPSIMISGSGVSKKSLSKTKLLSFDPKKVCDRLKSLLQETQAGINSDKSFEESFAVADMLKKHKWMSKKQHKTLLVKCLN